MKYAIVTSSTKGIGKQIALDLLKNGYFVILNYFNDDSILLALNKELLEISPNYKIIKHDLTSIDKITQFIEKVKNITQYIDILVLNTAITNRADLYELSIENWQKVIDTNVSIPFFIVQGLGQNIEKNGNIVFIGALMGEFPHAISIPYGVSKAAVHSMAKYLVKYFNEKKITVNVVAPGFVETPWQKDKPPPIRTSIESKIALKRFGNVKEISSAVLYLIENRYINGHIIFIDGGYSYK